MAIAKTKQTKEVKVPVEEVEEKEEKPKTFKFLSHLYMVNPFSGDKFFPNQVTEVKEVEGWITSQQNAGILKPVE